MIVGLGPFVILGVGSGRKADESGCCVREGKDIGGNVFGGTCRMIWVWGLG